MLRLGKHPARAGAARPRRDKGPSAGDAWGCGQLPGNPLRQGSALRRGRRPLPPSPSPFQVPLPCTEKRCTCPCGCVTVVMVVSCRTAGLRRGQVAGEAVRPPGRAQRGQQLAAGAELLPQSPTRARPPQPPSGRRAGGRLGTARVPADAEGGPGRGESRGGSGPALQCGPSAAEVATRERSAGERRGAGPRPHGVGLPPLTRTSPRAAVVGFFCEWDSPGAGHDVSSEPGAGAQ